MGFEPMRTIRSTGSQGLRVIHSAIPACVQSILGCGFKSLFDRLFVICPNSSEKTVIFTGCVIINYVIEYCGEASRRFLWGMHASYGFTHRRNNSKLRRSTSQHTITTEYSLSGRRDHFYFILQSFRNSRN